MLILAPFLLQVLLPLAFIGWIASGSAGSRAAQAALVLATLLVLAAGLLTGLWLFPPWWTPWPLILLLFVAARRGERVLAARRARWRPSPWVGWMPLFMALVVGGWAATRLVSAVAGRMPPGAAVELAWPLEPGTYLVLNGGSTEAVSAHVRALHATRPRLRLHRGTAWGVDVVALDALGMRASGILPRDPAAYFAHGRTVRAPCDGTIVRTRDGRPDMPVPERDRPEHLAGNHLFLRCGDTEIVLAHFSPGTVSVRPGDAVRTGQPLAKVGNSGFSDEPHLHIHAQRPGPADAPFAGDPVPMRFAGRFLVRNDRIMHDDDHDRPR